MSRDPRYDILFQPIAWATYAGHRYAREFDMPDIGDALLFRREVTQIKQD